MIALSPARAPDQRGSASHVSRKPGDTCTCGAWAWSRWEDALCSEIGRLAVKCFVDDNYTIPTICAGLVPGGAGAGGESEAAVAVWIYPEYLDYLEHCNNVNIPLSLSPVSPPPNSLTTLSFPWRLAGRREGG